MKTLIKNGVVNDPANGIENEKLDILIDNGIIKEVGKNIAKENASACIDAKGRYVFPGLFDMHAHLREPGDEHKETIASGASAAAAGGFSSIACMANTKPPIDTATQIKYVVATAAREAIVNVFPYGAVTKGLEGTLITEMGDMIEAGAIGFSDDGANIANSGTMRRALEYLKRFNKRIIVHPEDMDLTGIGLINAGFFAERKGLHGVPKEAEEVIISRDIMLARLTGGAVHFTHISGAGCVELVKKAKSEGLQVTCDATPHHLSLTVEDVGDYNTNMKMNPPLRDRADLRALKKGILDGVIDAIATDHAPHTEFEKSLEFGLAPNGIIGFETAVPITLEHVIEYKEARLPLFARVLSYNPATLLDTGRGTLSKGSPADITIIDINREFIYTRESVVSKSKNSPYLGKKLKGKATLTIVGGKTVYRDSEA